MILVSSVKGETERKREYFEKVEVEIVDVKPSL